MSDPGSNLVAELLRFRPEGLTANAWAVKAGVSRTIWADLKRHGNPSRRTLEKLLAAAGSSLAEFEALRIGPQRVFPGETAGRLAERKGKFGDAQPPPLRLIASHPAGTWKRAECELEAICIDPGEAIGRLPCPASLAGHLDAYVVTMVGESMWPRFRAGRHLAVSPEAVIRKGDDVLVVVREMLPEAGSLAIVGDLVGKSRDRIRLRQFTPPRTGEILTEDIAAIHKILGELI